MCKTVLDKHAPLITKNLRKCHNQLWFNDQIKHEIQICRKKEAMLFKDPNEYNYWAFIIKEGTAQI